MHLDVRLPVGLMFVVMGAVLAGYGVLGDHTIYARSLGININAIWGGVLLAAGAVMLGLVRRRAKILRLARPEPVEGRARSGQTFAERQP